MTSKQRQDLTSEDQFPVSIVMQHNRVANNVWITDKWDVEGVVAGEYLTVPQRQRSISRMGDSAENYLWSGYLIALFKDEVESYYFNIVSDHPYVFVICRDEEENGELIPFLVSVNYDEAASYMESDEQVFQVPMPPEIYRWVEAFVVDNYVPTKKKKRKRENWKDSK